MSISTRRRIVAAVAVATAAVLGAGCASSKSSASNANNDSPGSRPKQLVFAAVPSENNEDMKVQYQKVTDAIQKDLGVTVDFKTATSYAAVVEGMRSGTIDLAVFGPFTYVIAKNQGAKIEPLVAEIKTKGAKPAYKSYGITSKSQSGINSLSDFKGKKVCFVDPESTSGYLFPSEGLLEAGINPDKDVTPTFAGGHDRSAQAVANGQCDAGFAFDDMVDKTLIAKNLIKPGDLKVVWKSGDIPGSPVAIRSTFPADFKQQVQAEFEKLNVDYFVKTGACTPGDVNCGPDGGIYGYAKVDDAFYNPVRKVCDTTKSPACSKI